MEKTIICTVCPTGCEMKVTGENGKVSCVIGNTCKRGELYAKTEFSDPVRILTSTVKVTGSAQVLVPVRTTLPIPLRLMKECMAAVNALGLTAPVSEGSVLIENILQTGADLVTTGKA